VVEDNPFNVLVAKSLLEQSAALVDVAGNGVEALEKVAHGKRLFSPIYRGLLFNIPSCPLSGNRFYSDKITRMHILRLPRGRYIF
jgi:CheY-like chemotaxis protein